MLLFMIRGLKETVLAAKYDRRYISQKTLVASSPVKMPSLMVVCLFVSCLSGRCQTGPLTTAYLEEPTERAGSTQLIFQRMFGKNIHSVRSICAFSSNGIPWHKMFAVCVYIKTSLNI